MVVTDLFTCSCVRSKIFLLRMTIKPESPIWPMTRLSPSFSTARIAVDEPMSLTWGKRKVVVFFFFFFKEKKKKKKKKKRKEKEEDEKKSKHALHSFQSITPIHQTTHKHNLHSY